MKSDTDQKKLKDSIRSAVKRIDKAKDEKPTLLAQSVYLGTLGLMFVLPVVAGAYIGHWLDCKMTGYSFGFTVSLIIVGVFVGALNVYLFVRE